MDQGRGRLRRGRGRGGLVPVRGAARRGAACEEVDRARAHLHAALDGMHRAVAITGAPG
ncbi:MAG: hypothetical protein IPN17_23315 [Deltaproteobacteria bacterium]|nr:hypothetical protein [Deltaproteobacteria bacterium]